MIRLVFSIELIYEVADNPADFVFNIHAARTPWQSISSESLVLSQRGVRTMCPVHISNH